MQQYDEYSSEQLAMDSGFQAWVLHPTDQDHALWKAFLERYPHRQTIVEEAADLVRHSGLTTNASQNEAYLQGWSRLTREIKPSSQTSWTRYAVAAAVAGIAASVIYFSFFRTDNKTYHTAYGETREIALTDGSRVLLNANATLTVNAIGDSKRPRLVTLDGDAYFDVKHTSEDQPFIVHTLNNVDVHVVGTTFDMRQHGSSVEVLLKSGVVNLVAGKQEETLRPGQLAAASLQGITISMPAEQVTADRLAWVDGLYIMDDKSLTEVAGYITEHFGKPVVLNGPDLRAVKVTGKVPSNELPVLLEVLKQTLALSIEEEEGTLYIRSDTK